jgi:hypothetical protein
VRGRVFGVLNMLVSVASFLPILIVGPIADAIGTTLVLSFVAVAIVAAGLGSIFVRGTLKEAERGSRYDVGSRDPIAAALRAAEVPTPDPVGDFAEEMIEAGQEDITREVKVPKRVGEGRLPENDDSTSDDRRSDG